MVSPRLSVVRPAQGSPPGLATAADLGLLLFVLAVHAGVLVAFVVGDGVGPAAGGYATAVVLVGCRELVREVRAHLGAIRASRAR